MAFKVLTSNLLEAYTSAVKESPLEKTGHIRKASISCS
jgi:hypothetical protein